MLNILKNTTEETNTTSPWVLLLILTAYIILALIAFALISQLVVSALYGIGLTELSSIMNDPRNSPNARGAIMMMQAISSIGMFIATPIFFIHFNLHIKLKELITIPTRLMRPVFMTVLIVLCFMIANSIIIEWNQNLQLPEFLSWFESQAQAKELQLQKLTEYLTSFANPGQFIIALFIIAVIPAAGEELLFRGLFQNLFAKAFNNYHVGIWVAAILFGALHFQFYGIVPRILLGALFGYLYYWSGSITLAMLAHFINNGLTLILLYLSQLNVLDFDPTNTETSPPLYVIAIFFVGGAALLYLFKGYFKLTSNE